MENLGSWKTLRAGASGPTLARRWPLCTKGGHCLWISAARAR
ncbi:hypothetical protein [Hymenobacter cheonanensis]|nr:hypothetical protein [Hymenobacter sp. CA2-7]MDO7884873.1 hypothetical protein [Hymenobacter sp. CA2-7]